jgi:hypothetical protein
VLVSFPAAQAARAIAVPGAVPRGIDALELLRPGLAGVRRKMIEPGARLAATRWFVVVRPHWRERREGIACAGGEQGGEKGCAKHSRESTGQCRRDGARRR